MTVTSLRPLFPGVYLPSLLFEIGIGATIPMIVVRASDLGASIALAGFLTALLPIGKILADVPAGAIAARIGDRRTMILASGIAVAAAVVAGAAGSIAVFAIGVLVLGMTDAVYQLARQSYLTGVVHPLRRARAMSTLGGVHRIGLFIGPFVAAAIAPVAGAAGGFWIAAGASIGAAVVVILSPVLPGEVAAANTERVSMWQVLRENRSVYATLGVAIIGIGAVRGARQGALPLWTEHLGFDASATALIFGISGAIDMMMFYPAGKVMDSRGRLWVAIPSMLIMGAAMLVLPLAGTFGTVTAVAMVLGFGNGIGSGILMTLAADAAPTVGRSQFLGIWRLFADSGNSSGPLIVAGGAALGSLAAGIAAIGILSVGSVAALGAWVPRWSVHANARTRQAAGIPIPRTER